MISHFKEPYIYLSSPFQRRFTAYVSSIIFFYFTHKIVTVHVISLHNLNNFLEISW